MTGSASFSLRQSKESPMNLSTAAAGPAGMISEPPLSPGAAPPPPPAVAPSLEAQVVRIGLMTPTDVETTLKAEAETGRPFAELAVEHGHVDAADMARLVEAPAPEPVPELPPAAEAPVEAEVVPQGEAEPVPSTAEVPAQALAEVFLRLANGERIAAGSYDGQQPAEERAKELMRALDGDGDWPQIGGRFIRPDAVVSIDVELESV
jgi:hypothetical protein